MSIFSFGKRQRMHTQLHGTTTGREMFKVDEYNTRRKTTFTLAGICIVIFLIEYFYITEIPFKYNFLFFLTFIGCGYFAYSNFKQQRRLREGLY